eukprot:4414625-Prymnesium_polylepis.1
MQSAHSHADAYGKIGFEFRLLRLSDGRPSTCRAQWAPPSPPPSSSAERFKPGARWATVAHRIVSVTPQDLRRGNSARSSSSHTWFTAPTFFTCLQQLKQPRLLLVARPRVVEKGDQQRAEDGARAIRPVEQREAKLGQLERVDRGVTRLVTPPHQK